MRADGPEVQLGQVFDFGGWNFNGPGFEPTGEPLFATGAGSNSGNYSDPNEDKLITETHTSSSMTAFDHYATYSAQQLPFIWIAERVHRSRRSAASWHGVTFNPLGTLLPEYWYFTK